MGEFYSDTLEEGIRLLYFQPDEKRYQEGVRLLEKAVANEEADAYYFLARCYAWGEGGVQEDEGKARQLSKIGIQLGSDLCVLGADRMSALDGDLKEAMKHSLEESFEAVERIANAGEPMAQYAVGLFYFWGDMLMGIQKPERNEFQKYEIENGKKALQWFCAAAEQGCIPAMRNAFHSQRKGQNGVKQDSGAACRRMEAWKDVHDLAYLYYEVAVEYGRQQKYQDAIRWYELGAAHGDEDCTTVFLGLSHLHGHGVVQDMTKGRKILECYVQERDNVDAYFALGMIYDKGMGVPVNIELAVSYYQKALEEGNSAAEEDLARFKKGIFGKWKRR